MCIRKLFFGCIAAMSVAAACGAPAAPVLPGIAFGSVVPGLPLTRTVRSMRDMRYAGLVRQHSDFTCGAAALATILQQVYGRNISERDIVEDMLRHTDARVVRQQGFSLLDLKRYVERHGLRGHGYRIDANSLLSLKIPVIALQNSNGYAHFVVVKRISDGIAYLADPALGNRQMLLHDFLTAWNGIVFAVVGHGLRQENALMRSAQSLAARQRAAIATRALPPQQEFGLLGLDSF